MKKLLSIIIAVMILFCFTGCGDSSDTGDNATNDTSVMTSEAQTPSEAAEEYLKSIQTDPKLLLQQPSLKDEIGYPIFDDRTCDIVGELLKEFEYEIISEEELDENSYLVTAHIKTYDLGTFYRRYLEIPHDEYQDRIFQDPEMVELVHQIYLDEGNDEALWEQYSADPLTLQAFYNAAWDSGILTDEQIDAELDAGVRVQKQELSELMEECRANGKIDMEEDLVLQVVREDKNSQWNVWRLTDHLDIIGGGLVSQYEDWKGNLEFDDAGTGTE